MESEEREKKEHYHKKYDYVKNERASLGHPYKKATYTKRPPVKKATHTKRPPIQKGHLYKKATTKIKFVS